MSTFEFLSDIYPLDETAFKRLEAYVDHLKMWQQKTNLIAPSTLEEVWNRHIADSLQCLALKPDCEHWLDLGSGGGFPGMVIAIVMADKPNSSVHLIDSNGKKTAFLRQVNRTVKARADILTGRIEDFHHLSIEPEVVTARALTAMPNLLELASPWLKNGSIGLFHKGRDFRAELEECDGLWSFDLIHHTSKISSDSVLLEVSNLKSGSELGE